MSKIMKVVCVLSVLCACIGCVPEDLAPLVGTWNIKTDDGEELMLIFHDYKKITFDDVSYLCLWGSWYSDDNREVLHHNLAMETADYADAIYAGTDYQYFAHESVYLNGSDFANTDFYFNLYYNDFYNVWVMDGVWRGSVFGSNYEGTFQGYR